MLSLARMIDSTQLEFLTAWGEEFAGSLGFLSGSRTRCRSNGAATPWPERSPATLPTADLRGAASARPTFACPHRLKPK